MTLQQLHRAVIDCQRCQRLREYCGEVALEKRRAYLKWDYWGRPVPGFGDPKARIWIIGLAPAAHGGNRTGRVFTGDRSGDFLFAALHRAGLANQATCVDAADGLVLNDTRVAAAVRCAPPGNAPTPAERATCAPWLDAEWRLIGSDVRAIIALGAFAWRAALEMIREGGGTVPKPAPRFGHGATATLGPVTLIGCYHPSQQNTFTGKLTPAMLDDIFAIAGTHIGKDAL